MKIINDSVETNLILNDYGEFNRKVNILNQEIQKLNIPLQSGIGILSKRNINTIVAICAILKSGNFFIPIDESYTYDAAIDMLRNSHAVCYIHDDIIEVIDKNYPKFSFEDKLAYIIHTSGTTGKPKGVKISINNLTNYLSGFENQFAILKSDRFLICTSMAFDLSYTGLFLALKNRCYIRVADNFEAIEPDRLLKTIREEKITALKITPSILSMMFLRNREKTINTIRNVRLLVLGGEKINVEQIESLIKCNPHLTIINHYGPCETTIGCCMKIISSNNIEQYKKNTSIGKPFANNRVIIVDEQLSKVDDGKPGKLLIQGPGVGCGYVVNQENSKNFLLYDGNWSFLTSDIGYLNNDSEIILLGRDNSIVKYKGYRIALGEVTKQIERLNCFSNVVVSLVNINNHDKLVCYYQSDSATDIKYIRERLRLELPMYMVPDYFIRVDKFIYNSNGKLDYKVIEYSHKHDGTNTMTSTEEKIFEVWKKVTGFYDIDLEDSFFSIGLDSLSELEFIVSLEDSFESVVLSHKVLLRFDTISSLAIYISNYSIASKAQNDLILGNQTDNIADYFDYYKNLNFYELITSPATQKYYYRTGVLKDVILNKVFVVCHGIEETLSGVRKWIISDCSLRAALDKEQCKLFDFETVKALPLVTYNINFFEKEIDKLIEQGLLLFKESNLSFFPMCISLDSNRTLCIFMFNHNICKSNTIDTFIDVFSNIILPDISHVLKGIKTYFSDESFSTLFSNYWQQVSIIKKRYFYPLQNGMEKIVSDGRIYDLSKIKKITLQIDILFAWVSACALGKILNVRYVPITIWKNRSANTFLESYAWDFSDFEFYIIDTWASSYKDCMNYIDKAGEARNNNYYCLDQMLLSSDITYSMDNIYLNIIHLDRKHESRNGDQTGELCQSVKERLKKLKKSSIHGICIYGEIDDDLQNIKLCYSSNYDVYNCQEYIMEFDAITNTLMENINNGIVF